MIIPGLECSTAILEKIGNPQDTLRFIHVAGTNGKGSTCAFLSSILTQAGYKTGLFSSPYVVEINERIRVEGHSISNRDLATGIKDVQTAAKLLSEQAADFDVITAVAFSYFAQESCDIVICEVGVGGRFDATNVIDHPEVSVITSIGMDHQDTLGDTLEKIAQEKAGIIKCDSPVVSWPQEPEVRAILEQVARDMGTSITYPAFAQLEIEEVDLAGQRFSFREYKSLEIKLIPEYQARNAALAIEVIETLRNAGWKISDSALREGLASMSWPGRFEIVDENPLIIVDGAHNEPSVHSLVSTLEQMMPEVKPIFIIGFLENKDFRGMLEEVVHVASAFIIVEPPSPRALVAEKLNEVLRLLWQGDIKVARSFEDALEIARDLAGREGVICSFGSIYSVAPLYQALANMSGGKA